MLILSTVCSTMLLGACGSGSGDSTSAPSLTAPANSLATVDIRQGDTSPLADEIATEQLQRKAVENAAQGITLNTTGFQMFSENAANAANLDRMTNMFNDGFGDSLIAADSTSVSNSLHEATLKSGEIDEEAYQLLLATLGLDESGNARATRVGNQITIDPDDAAVCAGDTFALDVSNTAGERSVCEQLVSAMTVQLDAYTEHSGNITYLFNQQPLLVVGYGPVNAFYEVRLETLHELQRTSNQLSPNTEYTTRHMQGALRLTASAASTTQSTSSGTLALVIAEPLVIEEEDGSRLSMAPATLFTASHDEQAGTAHLELGMGAVEWITSALADEFTSGSSTVMMGGFSGIFDLSNNGRTLKARSLGFINGPLKMASSDGSAVSFNLAPFGFTLSTAIGEMLLDSALSATVSFAASSPDTGNVSVAVDLQAPASTRLDVDSDSASTLVQSGGPLNLNYRLSSEQGSENGFVSWAPGSCQSSSDQSQSAASLPDAFINCGTQF